MTTTAKHVMTLCIGLTLIWWIGLVTIHHGDMFAHLQSKKLGHGTMITLIGPILSRFAIYPEPITVTNLNDMIVATPFLIQGSSSNDK